MAPSIAGAWNPKLDWESDAGKVLTALFAHLPAQQPFSVTLFGSAPLQLGIERDFRSADVDLFSDIPMEVMEKAIAAAGLRQGEAAVHVQCCWESNFRSSLRWRLRAASYKMSEFGTLVLPHPMDLLIAKMHRWEEKDRRAFRLTHDRLGIPTEAELLEELRIAVDLFRPNFDEENSGDITNNTRLVWQEIFGRDIDVRQEIIAVGLERRRQGFSLDRPSSNYKAQLRKLAGG